MHTIIHPQSRTRRTKSAEPMTHGPFRSPLYNCADQGDALTLVVYLPGVETNAVNIEARGPDLVVTGSKAHFVRVNWQSLHLEASQRDYRLSLRLGRSLDYAAMQAEMHQGVLTITLPKRIGRAADARGLRQVA